MKTEQSIKNALSQLRKRYGLKAKIFTGLRHHIDSYRNSFVNEMCVCVWAREDSNVVYVYFPPHNGWGEEVRDTLINNGIEFDGLRLEWDGSEEQAIMLGRV